MKIMKKLFLGITFVFFMMLLTFSHDTTSQAGESYDDYKKVIVKTSGYYYLKNGSKSSKIQTNVALRYKRKKGITVYEGTIKKGKKEMVYLEKGTYYIYQYVLAPDYKWMINKKFMLKKISKKNIYPSVMEEDKYKKFYGNIKSGFYVKFTASKTGEISLDAQWLTYSKNMKQYISVVLCDSTKKKITSTNYYDTGSYDSDLVYGTGQPAETQSFLVEAGKTYYFYFMGNSNCFEAKYEYSEILDGVNKGGATKETSVAVVRNEAHIIGTEGAETQWYVYENTSIGTAYPSFDLFLNKCGWRSDSGIMVEAYDQSGNPIISGTSDDTNSIRLFEDLDYEVESGNKIYIKVTTDGLKPTCFWFS